MCPNGERITRAEKFVALILADSHQVKGAGTFPAVLAMAQDALMDERACRRVLAALERKGVIERRRGERQGRGQMTFYFFPELDRKGGVSTPLFLPQKEGRRGTERGQKGDKKPAALKEEQEQEQEQKQTQPPAAAAARLVELDSAREAAEAQPPGCARDDSGKLPGEPEISCAVSAVMAGCGFAPNLRAVRAVIRAVVEQERRGERPELMAKRMVEAWRAFEALGEGRLRWGAARFFGEGVWRDRTRWRLGGQSGPAPPTAEQAGKREAAAALRRSQDIEDFWALAADLMADQGIDEDELLRRFPSYLGTKPAEAGTGSG